MSNIVKINNNSIQIKEFKGQRVVTFKDIDIVHQRPEGTARRNFNENKHRFIEEVDYFIRNSYEAKEEYKITAPNGLVLITESGYLMLVKSFTDDLAWEAQRQLVNSYFRAKSAKSLPVDKQKEIEARYNNSLARKANVLLKIAANPDINPRYRQVLQSQASAIIAGKPLLPLPELEQKTYSAEEIGKMLGISANAVGRLAKQYNLKTDQYGKWYHDKSKYSAKEVETFRYYENVIPVLQEVLAEMRGRWKQ